MTHYMFDITPEALVTGKVPGNRPADLLLQYAYGMEVNADYYPLLMNILCSNTNEEFSENCVNRFIRLMQSPEADIHYATLPLPAKLIFSMKLLFYILKSNYSKDDALVASVVTDIMLLTDTINSDANFETLLTYDNKYSVCLTGFTEKESSVYFRHLYLVLEQLYKTNVISILNFPTPLLKTTASSDAYFHLRYDAANFIENNQWRRAKPIYALLYCTNNTSDKPSLLTHFFRVAVIECLQEFSLYLAHVIYQRYYNDFQKNEVCYIHARIIFLSLICAGAYFGTTSEEFNTLLQTILSMILTHQNSIVLYWSYIDEIVDIYPELTRTNDLLKKIGKYLSGYNNAEEEESALYFFNIIFQRDSFAGYPPTIWGTP